MSSVMPPAALQYETPPREVIASALAALKREPANLQLHRAVRQAGLAYKANGGKPLTIFTTIRLGYMSPVQRLMYYARLWAFDPANIYIGAHLLLAATDCEYDSPAFGPLVQWIDHLIAAARQGA